MLINASTKRNISGGFGANVKRAGRDILRFSALPLPCCFRRPAPIFWPANCHFQGGNNVKASLGVCFALSRNYVSSYRGTAIMRKKMHATVFCIRYRRGNSPERLHVEVYECAGEMPRLKLGVVIEAGSARTNRHQLSAGVSG